MKYLMIDGNNLAVRCAFANEGLSNRLGISTGVHYGVFQSLVFLRQKFPGYRFLMTWDGKSKRRMSESAAGVEKGIISSTYKANRREGEQKQPLLDFYEQAPYLKRAIGKIGIPQIRLVDFEADDVIASYCSQLKDDEFVVVTTDKDYYQILDDNVKIWNGSKEEFITKDDFVKSLNIQPKQHIDCGALEGDNSDNIFGVPSWGEKSALKAIQEYGSWEGLYAALHSQFDQLREKYPDVTGNDFEELKNIKTPSSKGKYPEIYSGIPFGGVALAFEKQNWKPSLEVKKGLKSNLLALMFEERVKLAYSLKKMDLDIPSLPEITTGAFEDDKIVEYFDFYDIESLKSSVGILKEEAID